MTTEKNIQLNTILTQAHYDHQKDLNARAYFKTSNHKVGEDLVQQTFLKTWMYLVKGGKVENMKAFLYHILNNLIIDQYRKHKSTSLDTLLEKGYEPSENKTESLIDAIDGKSILLLIKQLPIKYREIINMRFIQDLSLKEISAITNTTKNTIAVQIHRGIMKLKSMYKVS